MEALETLPDRMTRVELQLVQLRDEMRAEFSAIRGVGGQGLTLVGLRDEMRAEFAAIRGNAGAGVALSGLRRAIQDSEENTLRVLRDEIRAGDEETRRSLREEIRTGDEETRRYMRMLHEDVIARLAIIQEGRPPRKKR